MVTADRRKRKKTYYFGYFILYSYFGSSPAISGSRRKDSDKHDVYIFLSLFFYVMILVLK